MAGCPLCQPENEAVVYADALLRVIRVEDAAYPAYWRVVAQAHLAEWTDLEPEQRRQFMAAVEAVELTMRRVLQPAKVNLASLGNQVPHLHWHVVGRHAWDASFPGAIWAPPLREAPEAAVQAVRARLSACDEAIRQALADQPAAPAQAPSDF